MKNKSRNFGGRSGTIGMPNLILPSVAIPRGNTESANRLLMLRLVYRHVNERMVHCSLFVSFDIYLYASNKKISLIPLIMNPIPMITAEKDEISVGFKIEYTPNEMASIAKHKKIHQ